MAAQTILVTGGAGFIGTHLCRRLAADGHRVISLDNYFTGSKDNHLPGVDYREGHTKDIAKLVPEKPDTIYHLGEYARVAKSLEEPALVWDLNMDGTFGVLEFWRAKGCKLVYSGSSTKGVGARADGVVGRNLAPYTWSKAANCEQITNYARWYNLPFVITYFYNVYGPGERAIGGYGTVIETFRQRFLSGQALQVRSPGTQRRLFTHVEDTVNGLVLAAEQGQGDGYGLSSTDDYSLLEIAELFGGPIEMLPATATTRETAIANDEQMRALGWTQTKTLKEYIDEIKHQTHH
jgi:UDP-glucose 4-epimerase